MGLVSTSSVIQFPDVDACKVINRKVFSLNWILITKVLEEFRIGIPTTYSVRGTPDFLRQNIHSVIHAKVAIRMTSVRYVYSSLAYSDCSETVCNGI